MKSFSEYLKDKEKLNEGKYDNWKKTTGGEQFKSNAHNYAKAKIVIDDILKDEDKLQWFKNDVLTNQDKTSSEAKEALKAFYVISHFADIIKGSNEDKRAQEVGAYKSSSGTKQENINRLKGLGVTPPKKGKKYKSLKLSERGRLLTSDLSPEEFEEKRKKEEEKASKDAFKKPTKTEDKPIEDKPTEVEDKPTEDKPTEVEDKPVEDKPAEDKPTEVEDKPTGDSPLILSTQKKEDTLKKLNSIIDDLKEKGDQTRESKVVKLRDRYDRKTTNIIQTLTRLNSDDKNRNSAESQNYKIDIDSLSRRIINKDIALLGLRNTKENIQKGIKDFKGKIDKVKANAEDKKKEKEDKPLSQRQVKTQTMKSKIKEFGKKVSNLETSKALRDKKNKMVTKVQNSVSQGVKNLDSKVSQVLKPNLAKQNTQEKKTNLGAGVKKIKPKKEKNISDFIKEKEKQKLKKKIN